MEEKNRREEREEGKEEGRSANLRRKERVKE